MSHALARAWRTLRGVDILENEPMSRHTSFGIGGPAEVLAIPHTPQALWQLLQTCHEGGCLPLVLGNGTNIIVRDGGIRGGVIKIGQRLSAVRRAGRNLIAQGGASLAKLCLTAADCGLGGLGFAAGIPGTVGGAIWMNAGANGGDVGQYVTELRAFDCEGQELLLGHDDLDFAYRHSSLQGQHRVVVEVTFALVEGEPQALRAQLCEAILARCLKQPVAQPSAGCIFKRPPNDFAGRLVEAVGGKGLRVGGAQISRKHANFIVNVGGATARDVLELIERVRHRVYEEHGVSLETEVCVTGEDG